MSASHNPVWHNISVKASVSAPARPGRQDVTPSSALDCPLAYGCAEAKALLSPWMRRRHKAHVRGWCMTGDANAVLRLKPGPITCMSGCRQLPIDRLAPHLL